MRVNKVLLPCELCGERESMAGEDSALGDSPVKVPELISELISEADSEADSEFGSELTDSGEDDSD